MSTKTKATDRKLLELAALAAGITGTWQGGPFFGIIGSAIGDMDVPWNPLRNDGQALRLMVRLRLHAKHFSPYKDDFDIKPPGMVEVWQEDGEDPLHIEYFKPGDDLLAATRRAIVRAAAEIGRSMK